MMKEHCHDSGESKYGEISPLGIHELPVTNGASSTVAHWVIVTLIRHKRPKLDTLLLGHKATHFLVNFVADALFV